LEFPKAA
jgi:hypothetical protein